MKKKNKKILIWGVDPNQPGGLNHVTNIVRTALIKSGYSVLTLIYEGGSHDPQSGLLRYNKKEQNSYTDIVRNEVDLIISIGDMWNCEPIWDIVSKTAKPWVAHTSCEGLSYPKYARFGNNEGLNLEKVFELVSCIWAYDDRSALVFSHTFPGVKTQELPHAVSYDFIKNSPKFLLKKKLNLDAKKDHLALIVADNILRKGLDLFIEYVESLDDFHNWHGYIHAPSWKSTGVDLDDIIRVKGLQNKIFLRENIFGNKILAPQEIIGMYKDCDLYFHPHRAEGFGLTILEACVAGARVAATPIGFGFKLPYENQIAIENTKYLEHGGVGYYGYEPFIKSDDLDPDHIEPWQPPDDYDFPAFIENINRLVELDYEPKIWRKL